MFSTNLDLSKMVGGFSDATVLSICKSTMPKEAQNSPITFLSISEQLPFFDSVCFTQFPKHEVYH